MAKRKLWVYQPADFGENPCGVCSHAYDAPFSLAVCPNCGHIEFGCDLCPLNYSGRPNCHFKAVCDGKNCPAQGFHDLYAIFDKKELESLPPEYVGMMVSEKRSNYIRIMLDDRIHTIYSERKVVGITTIDMHEWRKGNRDLKGVRKIENVVYDESDS